MQIPLLLLYCFIGSFCALPCLAQQEITLKGHIEVEGQPVKSATIVIDTVRRVSDGKGSFSIVLPPSANRDWLAYLKANFRVLAKQLEVKGVEITQHSPETFYITALMRRVKEVAGKIKDQNDKGLAGIRVQVANAPQVPPVVTNADGVFIIKLPMSYQVGNDMEFLLNGLKVGKERYHYIKQFGFFEISAPPNLVLRLERREKPTADAASQSPRLTAKTTDTTGAQAKAKKQPKPSAAAAKFDNDRSNALPPPASGRVPLSDTTLSLSANTSFEEIEKALDAAVFTIENDRQRILQNNEILQRNIGVIVRTLSSRNNLDPAQQKVLLQYLDKFEGLLKANEDVFRKLQIQNDSMVGDMKLLLKQKDSVAVKTHQQMEQAIEQSRQNFVLWLLTALLGITSTAIFIMFYRRIREKKQVAELYAQALAQANEQVQQANQSLELLVAQRTAMLKAANQELDAFLYRSSHDLRRPLTSIIGLSQVAAMLNPPDEIGEILAKMRNTSVDMDKMLGKLITVSNIYQTQAQPEGLILKNVVDNALHKYAQELQVKQVEVICTIPATLTVHADKMMLDIVLGQLLANSLRYAKPPEPPHKPLLRISAEPSSEGLRLAVFDNGMGIEPQYLPHLFDMFFVANDTTPGHGLGLFIVKKALEKLGGQAEVRSEINTFTEVIVTLPQGPGT